MKYSYCEKLMWLAMNGVIFELLEEKTPDVDCKQWKKKSKERYKQIISELDEIGDMMKNPLRVSLSGGAVWMAVYETAPNKMSEKLFSEMVTATMGAPIIKKAFSGKNPFSLDYQKKKAEKDKIANGMSSSPYNWVTETIPGRDGDEYTTIYRQCGLCELGRKLGHSELVPYMCQMDYISVDMMGGVLHRTKTLATGGGTAVISMFVRKARNGILLKRIDKYNFQLCAQLRVCSQAGGNPVYPRFSQPDNSESWDDVGNGI